MKELTEALERLVKANKNNTGESVMSAIENAEKTIQKAKQKEAIEQSTNWQMKEEYSTGMKDKMLMPDMEYKQPELSAEEFLRSKMEQEDLKDYFANFYLGISGKRYYMKDLLTEFKNQNG